MIDRRDRGKCGDCMTIFADVRGRSMRLRLADRIDRVVATYTVAGNVVVLKIRRQPAIGGVAIFTGIATLNVILRFTIHDGIVMAARAATQDLQVIDAHDRDECYCRMAIFADACRCDVRRIFSGCAYPIVTTHAISNYIEVIEEHGKPCGSLVAGVALLLSRWMVRWLSDILNIVVASRTATENRIMIHHGQWEPTRRSVAVLAEFCAQDMIGGLGARANPATVGMASNATHGCPLEYPTEVTRLAIDR